MLQIGKENNNTYLQDAIDLEMKNVMIAFCLCTHDLKNLHGYKGTHMIFDVKFGENFRRKARLVADGHKTDPPSSIT